MNAKTEPISAKNTRPMPSEAIVKRGSEKNVSGSIGEATRRSHQTNAPPRPSAATNPPSTSGSVQPRGVASMIE